MAIERLQLLVIGIVQGVGFRPQVYRLAQALRLTGWVQNHPEGVLIEIQGVGIHQFTSQLLASLPPMARVDAILPTKIDPAPHESDFQIIHSAQGPANTMISPDLNVCPDCLHELFDPESRYFYYPFLNCMHCGPRFTMTHHLPYDRATTAMAAFALCPACQKDYHSPTNRRYHAQPTACTECGPQLSMPLTKIAQALAAGQIVALKGQGGYQLLCDARNAQAIMTLRQRKARPDKPLAVMVLNTRSANNQVALSAYASQLLESAARPIVLLPKIAATLPAIIAPNLAHLGIMLPSTPIHYLLFHALLNYPAGNQWLTQSTPLALIVTSANINGNPLITDDIIAKQALTGIADQIITYNRCIVTRADDSVMQMINDKPAFIRRARGFAPLCIKLPSAMPSTLALGGYLKNTFCITRDNEAFVSQHIGSLTNKQTIDFLHESLNHWRRFLGVKLERIACDQHPDFYTSSLAHEFELDIISVQHHYAHLAACAAEHQLLEPALGLALDGYGYGENAEAWGGELFLFDCTQSQHLGRLLPLPFVSGDRTAREPWRMAASVLHLLGQTDQIVRRFADQPQASLVANLCASTPFLPVTSSCGRLFDAASALLGINHVATYEGQAARELESLVTELVVLPQGWSMTQNQLSFLPLLAQLLTLDPISGANLFHGTLIAGLTAWVTDLARRLSIAHVVLSGGCFLNRILAEGLMTQLTQQAIKVYLPQQLPPNDGGLSLGQAFIAGTQALQIGGRHVSCYPRSSN